MATSPIHIYCYQSRDYARLKSMVCTVWCLILAEYLIVIQAPDRSKPHYYKPQCDNNFRSMRNALTSFIIRGSALYGYFLLNFNIVSYFIIVLADDEEDVK